MRLKNKELKLKKIPKIKFSSKNLFIFLISLFIVGLLTGIIFFLLMNNIDKNSIIDYSKYFSIDNTNYITSFRNNLLENTFNIFLIWILGLSVIGVLFVIIIYFFHAFSLGLTLASIITKYKLKGIIGVFCYIFPSKICYLLILFLLSFFSIKISYKIIKLCFLKAEISIKPDINKYFKILLFSFISILLISLLKVFIDPIFLNFFN